MMPDLMRDHIRLGEVAPRTEAITQFTVERKIDIHLAVTRAIERTHRGLPYSARRLRVAGEHHELGRRIILIELRAKDVLPGALGVAEHAPHEHRAGILRGRP